MPNEVYRRTRDGLAALVSPRVADSVLSGALRDSGVGADDIDSIQMRNLLMGPVLVELQNVLPSRGLKRNLRTLAGSLVGLDADTLPSTNRTLWQTVVEPPRTDPQPQAAVAVGAVAASTPGPSAPGAAVTALEPTVTAEAGTGVAPAPEPVVGSGGAIRQVALTREQWEVRLTRFAQLEQVQLVAATGGDGTVISSRGEGADVQALGRLGTVAMRLLSRSGTVRSLHISHTSGELFLFPVADQLLVLLGSRALNLGAVATTFASLFLEEVV